VIPDGIRLQNPLWQFALEVYPRLSEPLLALQTEGARVNQLLAALWCVETGRAWPGPIPKEIEAWHNIEVLPMRQRRMALKPQLADHPELEKLYQAYKQVELNCERVELAMLYQWLEGRPSGEAIDLAATIADVLELNAIPRPSQRVQPLIIAYQKLISERS